MTQDSLRSGIGSPSTTGLSPARSARLRLGARTGSNLVKLPEQYQWSSYATYIKPNLKPYWLHTTETLKRHDATESIKKFQQFTNAGVDQATLNFFTKSGLPPILGSLDFIKKISDKYLPLIKNNTEISDQRLLTEVPNIAMIMQATSDFFNIPTATLTTVQRKTGNYPRKLAIYLAHELSNQSIQTIANHFKNTTYSGISKAHLRVKDGITKNTALANDINLLTDLLMSYVKT